jgi:hypothetical protein
MKNSKAVTKCALKNWLNVKLMPFKIKYILSCLREMDGKKNLAALSVVTHLTFILVQNRLSGERIEIDYTVQDFQLEGSEADWSKVENVTILNELLIAPEIKHFNLLHFYCWTV